jgi:hypothetical protein
MQIGPVPLDGHHVRLGLKWRRHQSCCPPLPNEVSPTSSACVSYPAKPNARDSRHTASCGTDTRHGTCSRPASPCPRSTRWVSMAVAIPWPRAAAVTYIPQIWPV